MGRKHRKSGPEIQYDGLDLDSEFNISSRNSPSSPSCASASPSPPPAKRSKPALSYSDAWKALREINSSMAAGKEAAVEKRKKEKVAKQKQQIERIGLTEEQLRKRFIGGVDLSPTKRARLDKQFKQAATEIVRQRDNNKQWIKDMHVFSTVELTRNNIYEETLVERDDGWYKFMKNSTTRTWFFSNGLFEQFDDSTFPALDENCTKWIEAEMCREMNEWLRRRYAQAWKVIVQSQINRGISISVNDALNLAIRLLVSVGAKEELLRNTDGFKNEHYEDVYGVAGLSLPTTGVIQTVIKCVAHLSHCVLAKKGNNEFALSIFRILTICGLDCVLSSIGSEAVAEGLAMVADSVSEDWIKEEKGAGSGNIVQMFMTLLSGDNVLRTRLLDLLGVAGSYCETNSAFIYSLRQRLAIAFFLNTSYLAPMESNGAGGDLKDLTSRSDEVLTDLIMPFIEKDELFIKIDNDDRSRCMEILDQQARERKFHLGFLTNCLPNLRYVESYYSSTTSTPATTTNYGYTGTGSENRSRNDSHVAARQKLAHFIQRQIDITNRLDLAGDVPHIMGLSNALTSLQTLIRQNYTQYIDEYGV